MSRTGRLTPFSYVILALVGRGGAGPHDIVRMMREGAIFWTTSESHYYAEPRRLATLGFLQSRTEPGRTRPRTHYELTDAGREALTAWLAEPAAMPRVQNECVVKLLAADFSDDATIAASLAGVRVGIQRAYQDLEEMERRALQIPHRTRYLRLIDDYARRSLDAQREWLDAVQEELERQPSDADGAAERAEPRGGARRERREPGP
jgi:PadR family transcriptional regulator AphA